MAENDSSKICSICCKKLPIALFLFRSDKRNSSWCKPCAYAQTRAWNEKNKPRLKALREKHSKLTPRRRQRAYEQKWRDGHKELLQARSKIYYKNNKLSFYLRYRKRRALQLDAPGDFTESECRRLLELQRFLCVICRTSIRKGFHRDHIVPLSRGGSNDILNIQLLCQKCNHKKGAKDPINFMQSSGFLI